MLERVRRLYGYRKLLAGVIAWPLSALVLALITLSPPQNWAAWPAEAREAVISLSTGLHMLLWGLWLIWLTGPFAGWGRFGRGTAWLLRISVVLWWTVPALGHIGAGVWLCCGSAQDSLGPICWQVARVVGLPAGFGALVMLWPDMTDRFRGYPLTRRAFVSGQGHSAGWESARGIARRTAPFPTRPPRRTGHLSSTIYLGQTLFEHSFHGNRHVFLKEESHLVTIGMTGSGKLISAIAPNLCLYRGSAVVISPKPELADMFAGRRVDVARLDAHRAANRPVGIDPRGITAARYHLPSGRVFILDPGGQGVYPSSRHTILSEVDLKSDDARSLIMAIASGIVPENPRATEPFFRQLCHDFVAAGIAHALTAFTSPRSRTLPFVADMLMGIDETERRADPEVFSATLIAMMQNPALGGFIQSRAVNVMQLGDRAFGSVIAELGNHLSWMTDPAMRTHLSGPSEFSYRELGDDRRPITVFLVPPRLAMQEALPFLRVHAELALQLLVSKRNRPAIPTLFLCDEFRQYGQKIAAIRDGATILREARVKLWLFAQSWPSLVDTIGEDGTNELRSCSAMQYFGINDGPTAERISRELGQYTLRRKGRGQAPPLETTYDVVTPAEVMHELRKTAPLQYVFPSTGGPLRLKRVAHCRIKTSENAVYHGLPLGGHFDAGLSRFTQADRAV